MELLDPEGCSGRTMDHTYGTMDGFACQSNDVECGIIYTVEYGA